ncbi:MAG: phosphodiesterase [Xanthomonadaceae bacterium]|nr:phosphodiesterase [Xanthomonadaceae bacterium]
MLNWRAGHQLISQRLRGADVDPAPFAVLLMRLRRLHEFHRYFGFAAGEELTRKVREMASSVLLPEDRVQRIGDSDFVVLLARVHSAEHAQLAALRLIRAFEERLAVGQHGVLARVAIGIAIHPEHGLDAEQLLRRADIACARAEQSSSGFATFQASDDAAQFGYQELLTAIENNRLQVYLQPIISLGERRLAAVESLARWTRDDGKVLAPSDFIPYAEQTGLITALTRWSFNTSLQISTQLVQRMRRKIPISINLSPRALIERGMVEQILSILAVWQVPAEQVILEVTETAVMQDPQASVTLLERLRDHGLRIAIDDFGTGAASFTYLQRLPLTDLKIDQSFIHGLGDDSRAMNMVGAIIDLAHTLGIRVVAEGVHDSVTLELLSDLGCDFAQGFFVGKPQPAATFDAAQWR